LIECFAAGIPFFPFTLLGDVVFSLGLFGIAILLINITQAKSASLNEEIA